MLPFFHPTSVILVDDDPLFLESFAFRYGNAFLCRIARSPEEGLELVQQFTPFLTSVSDLFVPHHSKADALTPGDRLIQFKSSRIAAIPESPRRFATISVAVVDYDMPSMTGIEFCRRIKHLSIRKILLTGKVGHDTAVKAFNEGLIHSFLMKQDAEITTKLADKIREQQAEFFRALTRALSPVVGMEDMGFVTDLAFWERFQQICGEHGIVEYYVQASQPGVLLINETGGMTLLAVYDEDSMRAQLETAIDAGAPQALIEALRRGNVLLVCPTPTGFYEPRIADAWPQYLWPAQTIVGKQRWHLALIPHDANKQGLRAKFVSLASYRSDPLSA